MERTLFSFIWAHSKRDQIILVLVTVCVFPLLYLTLELPKRIINDALGAVPDSYEVFGYLPGQQELLTALCVLFLLSVIAHGLLKMRVNTMKGVLAERLLRRFRYALIGRILRFPLSYQKRLSEGELTSMVTAETEPLGGLMGDAVASPLFLAGQMLTILLFLFVQSFWFGLAAVALIPLQAWIIPRMQAKINKLNRARIQQVRLLAGEIGEITAGASVLRQHRGWRFRLARISARLGTLFEIRFEIYQRKFFMKFVNNLLTQLTPFFFFLVGGWLVINGQLTVGALVAALSAFKDLSSPWKELLTYYTKLVEMSQRYELVIDRFAPVAILPDFLSDASAQQTGKRAGLNLQGVTLQDDAGHTVLNAVDLDLPAGAWTLFVVEETYDRRTLGQMLARERMPLGGRVLVGDRALNEMPQAEVAAAVGYVTSNAYVFDGTFGENLLMPRLEPPATHLPEPLAKEAERTGNSADSAEVDWRVEDETGQLAKTLLELAVSIGAEKGLVARALNRRMTRDDHMRTHLVALRGEAARVLEGKAIQIFSRDAYIGALTVAENLFFGIAAQEEWFDLRTSEKLNELLIKLGLRALVLRQSMIMAETLVEAFDEDAEASPLFQQIGLPPDMLSTLHRVIKRAATERRTEAQAAEDEQVLMSLVLNLPAIRFDRSFSETLRSSVVAARSEVSRHAGEDLQQMFLPIDADTWNPKLNLLENVAFGKFDTMARARQEDVRQVMTDFLVRALDSRALGTLISDLPTGRGGSTLSADIAEVISVGQTLVKAPALVILDNALASYDPAIRRKAFDALRRHLPDATFVQLEASAPSNGVHDLMFELRQGGLWEDGSEGPDTQHLAEGSDLQQRIQALRRAPIFSGLTSRQLRMLAFSAQWVDVPAASYVFRKGDAPDGAYLLFDGAARLIDQNSDGVEQFRFAPEPGAIIGELSLIKKDTRRLDMYAETDLVLLRIESEDFLSILENDAETAFKLIEVLIGYVDQNNN